MTRAPKPSDHTLFGYPFKLTRRSNDGDRGNAVWINRIAVFVGHRIGGHRFVGNGLNGGPALNDTPEFGIKRFLVQLDALRAGANEKLTAVAVGVGPTHCHRHDARLIGEGGRKLSVPSVTGTSTAIV